MKLAEAIADFVSQTGQTQSDPAIVLLREFLLECDGDPGLEPDSLHDFLSRWYVEYAHAAIKLDSGGDADATRGDDQASSPGDVCDSLSGFVQWCQQNRGFESAGECLAVIEELRVTLPRVFELNARLIARGRQAKGAFEFPEFLVSFEEGGRGLYDFDQDGKAAALEGYFRIVSVRDNKADAEDLITGETVGPVLLPVTIAALLEPGYVINLELIHRGGAWSIAGSGLVYPPGFRI